MSEDSSVLGGQASLLLLLFLFFQQILADLLSIVDDYLGLNILINVVFFVQQLSFFYINYVLIILVYYFSRLFILRDVEGLTALVGCSSSAVREGLSNFLLTLHMVDIETWVDLIIIVYHHVIARNFNHYFLLNCLLFCLCVLIKVLWQ